MPERKLFSFFANVGERFSSIVRSPKPDRDPLVPYFRKRLTDLLTGKEQGIPRERLEWAGYTKAVELYRKGAPDNQTRFVEAIRSIISQENDWGVVADTIHIARTLHLEQLRSSVETFGSNRLQRVDPEWRETLGKEVAAFLQSEEAS